MGIGVSYTGYDGKTRHKVVEGAAELPGFMGDTRRPQTKAAKIPSMRDKLGSALEDPVDGPLIGIEGNKSSEPDGQRRVAGERGGWRIPVSRTEIETEILADMGCTKVTLTKLQYDLIISEKGFVKGRTEERKVWTKPFFALMEGTGSGTASGKYEVRPEWTTLPGDSTPRLAGLLFGTGDDLDGELAEVKAKDGVTEVKVFSHGEMG